MYLRLINVKAIERQRDSYILVINNRYEKMGESLYRINKDALEIIRNLNGTKTFDDLVDMMISCHLEKKEQAKYKLNNFLNELEKKGVQISENDVKIYTGSETYSAKGTLKVRCSVGKQVPSTPLPPDYIAEDDTKNGD